MGIIIVILSQVKCGEFFLDPHRLNSTLYKRLMHCNLYKEYYDTNETFRKVCQGRLTELN